MNNYIEKTNENRDKLISVFTEKRELWNEYVFLSWQWILLAIISVVIILLFIRYRKKMSTARLLLAGFSSCILAVFLDTLGDFYNWYDYRYDLIPGTPNLIPWDAIFIPIAVMFTLQIKPKVNPIIKAILFSGITSFVVLPFLSYSPYYYQTNWSYFYSFLILIFIYLVAYGLTRLDSHERL
ncbi:hypothetical protein CFK37_18900 [Virgibacillus phasianinus]|uniref:Uncharacterized protein n=1 Tax=Virgibacillus phasianinus TaxID=2017483 RepID=A0A220U854_9BACI|nr:CBO0543 family protein [Virgibacillus phasianinus]ASK64076.1 hypothetical protein CFK37_18900 [Virgibacillus phasianinus]